MYKFKNTVHPVLVDLKKVAGFTREGSQIFITCEGAVQPIVVSFTTLGYALVAEADLTKELTPV